MLLKRNDCDFLLPLISEVIIIIKFNGVSGSGTPDPVLKELKEYLEYNKSRDRIQANLKKKTKKP